mgnify:CR=1 FL=1
MKEKSKMVAEVIEHDIKGIIHFFANPNSIYRDFTYVNGAPFNYDVVFCEAGVKLNYTIKGFFNSDCTIDRIFERESSRVQTIGVGKRILVIKRGDLEEFADKYKGEFVPTRPLVKSPK